MMGKRFGFIALILFVLSGCSLLQNNPKTSLDWPLGTKEDGSVVWGRWRSEKDVCVEIDFYEDGRTVRRLSMYSAAAPVIDAQTRQVMITMDGLDAVAKQFIQSGILSIATGGALPGK